MKKFQLLTAFALLGSIQMMVASTATAAKISIPVTNKSNAFAKIVINFNDNNNNSSNSGVIAPGLTGTISVDKGKTIKNVMVFYYTGKEGNTALEKTIITVTSPTEWPVSLYVYGDGKTTAGSLVGTLALESKGEFAATTLTANSLSRFLAYWTGSATAADEITGKQPVAMYTLSTDGLFTTLPVF